MLVGNVTERRRRIHAGPERTQPLIGTDIEAAVGRERRWHRFLMQELSLNTQKAIVRLLASIKCT